MTSLGALRQLLLLLSAAEVSVSSLMGRSLSAPQLAAGGLGGKTLQFVSVSESHYDHTHHTHHHHQDTPDPHLALTNDSREVYLGATATLDCTVHDLTNQSVSWMRQVGDSLTLLTWDTHTYVSDDRYGLVQEEGEGWQRWRLVIQEVASSDGGQYRCQVATVPPLVMTAALTVLEPRVRVVEEGGRDVEEKHYNSGSRIELQCVIDRVPFPARPVTWRRGNTVLAFNTSRGGISVKGDEAAGFLASRLYVTNAAPSDSGRYSCCYHTYASDTVTVHVIAGENSAGLQHDAPPESSGAASSSSSTSGRSKGRPPVWLWLVLAYVTTCLTTTYTTAAPHPHPP